MKYINRDFQKLYDAILANARNPASDMYHNGAQRTGAGHREAFWNGYNGTGRAPVRGTMAAVCYRAGKDFRREQDRAAKVK